MSTNKHAETDAELHPFLKSMLGHVIGGRVVESASGKVFETLNPATGKVAGALGRRRRNRRRQGRQGGASSIRRRVVEVCRMSATLSSCECTISLEASRYQHVKKVVGSSSNGVYGAIGDEPNTDDSPLRWAGMPPTLTLYCASKIMGEGLGPLISKSTASNFSRCAIRRSTAKDSTSVLSRAHRWSRPTKAFGRTSGLLSSAMASRCKITFMWATPRAPTC
jgi:hypothetical protein